MFFLVLDLFFREFVVFFVFLYWCRLGGLGDFVF